MFFNSPNISTPWRCHKYFPTCSGMIRQMFILFLCTDMMRACLSWRLGSTCCGLIPLSTAYFPSVYTFLGVRRYSHIDCSGNGVCIDGVCTCDAIWTGEACEIQVCPNNCSHSHGQGECNRESHHCDCMHGYKGEIIRDICSNIPRRWKDIHLS